MFSYANVTTFLGGNLDAFFINPEDREQEEIIQEEEETL